MGSSALVSDMITPVMLCVLYTYMSSRLCRCVCPANRSSSRLPILGTVRSRFSRNDLLLSCLFFYHNSHKKTRKNVKSNKNIDKTEQKNGVQNKDFLGVHPS